MEEVKVIKVCPVCQSEDIQQLTGAMMIGSNQTLRYGRGSYCMQCGVKFQHNTEHLTLDLAEERESIKRMQSYISK